MHNRWDRLTGEVQRLERDLHTLRSEQSVVQGQTAGAVPSYGAQYTMVVQPYGMSAVYASTESAGLPAAADAAPLAACGKDIEYTVGRQSEHMAYARN